MNGNEGGKKRHVFMWKIQNFSMCTENRNESLYSPIFKANSLDETAWYIRFYPRGRSNSQDGYVSCFLHRVPKDSGPLEIECEIFFEIVDKKGKSLKCCSTIRKFERRGFGGFLDYMERDNLVNTVVQEDTLIIRCQIRANAAERALYSQNCCTTTVNTRKFTLQWEVKNLNAIPFQEVVTFSFSESKKIKIAIKIPEDDMKICFDFDNHISSYFVKCNCILLDTDGKEQDSKRASHLITLNQVWQFPTFIKKSQLKAKRDIYLKDDCFTMKFDFVVSDDTVSTRVEEKEESFLTGQFTDTGTDSFAVLKEDIRRLHTDKILTDVKLQVDRQIFSAHKCILSARSPVFFAMFNQDMAESQKGEVNIPDLDAKTVDLFLEYIYTGNVNDLDYENAMKLIMAADKYQVLSLKNKCAELLTSMLSDANVCEILVTADLVQHDTLKAFAFDCIKKQPHKIFKSDEWKQSVKRNLELATETICEVSRLWGDQTK